MVVMERTKQGEPHLHILVRGPYLSKQWLSKRMDELVRAPIVDVSYIRSAKKAAQYVAKYIGKDPHQFDGCKRYWRSLDYMHPTRAELKRQRTDDCTFYFIRGSYANYIAALARYGIVTKEATAYSFTYELPADTREPVGCRWPKAP